MPFIGNTPARVPLTSADIADSIITSAKIVDGTIVNADINASAGLVLTKLASTGTLTVDNIQFPATAVASANANNLDDYEEGTFTPTIVGSTTDGTATYSVQVGRYTKIGNIVFVNIVLSYSSGNGTGNLRISNLPFTSLSAASDQSLAMSATNIALTAIHVINNYILSNSTQVIITSYPSGGGAGANVAYDASGFINVTGHYEV